MRKRHGQHEEELEFQIAPMIDVLLVILVFFIICTSASVLRSDQNLTLPVAPSATKPATTWSETMLNVRWQDKKGWVTVDMDRFDKLDQLSARLQKMAATNPRFRVLIRADRATPASYVQNVMEAAAAAGISEIVFTAINHD